MLLPAAELTIDHVTVAGKDLKAMQATFAALGIPSEYGGPHSNRATEMALTSFPDGSYLELIAIQPNADPAAVAAHYWSKHMQNEGGPAAWAVRPGDLLAAEVKRLEAAGIDSDLWIAGGKNDASVMQVPRRGRARRHRSTAAGPARGVADDAAVFRDVFECGFRHGLSVVDEFLCDNGRGEGGRRDKRGGALQARMFVTGNRTKID